MKTIMIPVGSRANLTSAKPLIAALDAACFRVVPVAFASALLDEYGDTAGLMRRDGLDPYELPCLAAGSKPWDMTRTTAEAATGFARLVHETRPDCMFIIGDRHEMLGPAIAAYQARIPIAHTMGGEVSGTIDDTTRVMLSSMASFHFTATEQARMRVQELVRAARVVHYEGSAPVWCTGCPRIDWVSGVVDDEPELSNEVMVHMHPDTDLEPGENYRQTRELCGALERVARAWERELRWVVLWPNSDAYADEVARALRRTIDTIGAETHRKMPPEEYFKRLAACRLAIGNSSAPVREGSFLGVPAISVGNRQRGREHAANTTLLPASAEDLAHLIVSRLPPAERPPRSNLYGDGNAAPRIAELLKGELA